VGEKIRRRPEIASKVFRAISDIDMRMICQGASERSIGFLVDESRAEESIKRCTRCSSPPKARLSLEPAITRYASPVELGNSRPGSIAVLKQVRKFFP